MNQVEAMAILVAVADAGSLSAGARALGMPLATVSRRVSDLEAYLGTTLLLRSKRGLGLTEAGAAFLAASRRLLDDLREAESAAAGLPPVPRGELTVTAPVVFGRRHLLPVVAEFLAEQPEVDVRVVLGDRPANLADERADLAVRIGAGVAAAPEFEATSVGEVRVITCATPAHLGMHGVPQVPADLAGHPCVTFTALSGARRWTYPDGAGEQSVRVRSRLVVNTAEAAISAALAGVGLTRAIDYQVAGLLQSGRLVRVLQAFEPAPLAVTLLHLRREPVPLRLRTFLAFAAPRLRERLAP
jgi:DNA-binding transcriptional LysR family regulator